MRSYTFHRNRVFFLTIKRPTKIRSRYTIHFGKIGQPNCSSTRRQLYVCLRIKFKWLFVK